MTLAVLTNGAVLANGAVLTDGVAAANGASKYCKTLSEAFGKVTTAGAGADACAAGGTASGGRAFALAPETPPSWEALGITRGGGAFLGRL